VEGLPLFLQAAGSSTPTFSFLVTKPFFFFVDEVDFPALAAASRGLLFWEDTGVDLAGDIGVAGYWGAPHHGWDGDNTEFSKKMFIFVFVYSIPMTAVLRNLFLSSFTMATAEYVYCFCCKTDIPWQHECEHCQSYTAPYPATLNIPTSQQKPITDNKESSDKSKDNSPPNMPMADLLVNKDMPGVQVEANRFYPMLVDVSDDEDNEDDEEGAKSYWWANARWPGANNNETDEEEGDEDNLADNDTSGMSNETIDWDLIEKMSGLSAWDKMGEAYEQEAATICGLLWQLKIWMPMTDHHISTIVKWLAEYDCAICCAFAYKISTHTTNDAFNKIPYVFPQNPPLPKIDSLHSCIMFLSGFKPKIYQCCINSCVCYVGPHVGLTQWLFCQEDQYKPDGQPRHIFTYIPLIPQLIAFLANAKFASSMCYHHEHHHQPGKATNVFNLEHYHNLQGQHIKVNRKSLNHKYFEDARNIALGLLTNSFAPFKNCKNTAWPLIIFLYNLPPEIQFHMSNILSLGIVPGPKKPKDVDSFLWPLIQELLWLAHGVCAFNIIKSELFTLQAFLILFFGDIPAVSMLMWMKGHNGISPCQMCEIVGLWVPGAWATTHYVPLDCCHHPIVKADPTCTKVYNPSALPSQTHRELLKQATKVETVMTNAEADQLAKAYGIKGTPILLYLDSLSFPGSFPYDFMCLIWENLIKNLILHWTGKFKGLNEGNKSYQLSQAIWEGIGTSTAAAGSAIPSAYGSCVPNIAKDCSSCSTKMWSFWTLYIGPVLLQNQFQQPKYYKHFVCLVELLNICLQFEITDKEIETVRQGFIKWVKDSEE
jgi:hypothetical protein